MTRQYRFVGKGLQIPYGAIVNLVYWGKKRKVIVEHEGKKYVTMGTLLRKVKS